MLVRVNESEQEKKKKFKELKNLFFKNEMLQELFDDNWKQMTCIASLYDYSQEFEEKAKSHKVGDDADKAVVLYAKLLKISEGIDTESKKIIEQMNVIKKYFTDLEDKKYNKKFDNLVKNYEKIQSEKFKNHTQCINSFFSE